MFQNYNVINSNNNNNNNNNNGESDGLFDSRFGQLLNGKKTCISNWANTPRLNFPSINKNVSFQTANEFESNSTNHCNPLWMSAYNDSFEGGDYGKIGRLPRAHQRHSPVAARKKQSVTPAVHERGEKTARHARKHRGGHNRDEKETSQKLLQLNNTKSPESTSKPFSTEQHYQHYYSYYFNRKPESPQEERKTLLPQSPKRQKDSTDKHYRVENVFYYRQYKPVSQIMNEHIQKSNRSNALVCKDDERFHVLREKLVNNNVLFDEGQWLPDEDVIKVTEGLFDIGHMDPYESKLISKDAEAVSQAANKQNSLEREFGNSVRRAPWNRATSKNNSHWKSQDQSSDDEYGMLKELKRPPPNNTEKNGIKTKKHSPPTGPRVLLYNCNSPNLSRTSLIRPLDSKRTCLKSPKTRNTVNRYSEIDKVAERYERLARAVSPQRPPHQKNADKKPKIAVEHPINHIRVNDVDNNNDAYSDDGDDDDLDNVSNNDGSDASDSSSDSENGYRAYVYKMTHPLDHTITPQSITSSETSQESLSNPPKLLVASLFPNVPPYLSFSSNTRKGPEVMPDLHRVLKWRVTNVMPKVVRLILANSGMRLLKKTNDFMGVWGKHMKSPCFKTIRPYQKINHLPGSFKIGRKDSCWKNLQRQMNKHGKKDFGFMPKTFVIPNDLKALRRSWPKYAERNVKWIIKPPASARGAGIRVVNRWAQIPKRKPLIVQKYIERPLLINGSKFDLRLYVLVTSVNPLRVFMYHNGLARFASVKYSDKTDTLHDRCMHLTNYSINKFSTNYSKNEDVNACHGHKWTIKSLWSYLANRGIHTEYLWEALRSLVLRTILAGESAINSMIKTNVQSKYSCFELFGFDVLLDAELIPWLLEVNISPSLHSELPLDSHVKAPLVQGVLNTALFNVPPKLTLEKQKEIASEMLLPPGPICYDKRMYVNYLSRAEKIKHNAFTRKTMEDRDQYVNAILTHLTPDDVRCLIVAEDELARCAPLERIFPTNQTYKYLKYTDNPRYYNRLLDAWENRYGDYREEGIALLREYCKENYHLEVPPSPAQKYFEDDDTVYYLRPEYEYAEKPGLLHQISEMDFKIIIAAIVFVMVASVTLFAISTILVKYSNT